MSDSHIDPFPVPCVYVELSDSSNIFLKHLSNFCQIVNYRESSQKLTLTLFPCILHFFDGPIWSILVRHSLSALSIFLWKCDSFLSDICYTQIFVMGCVVKHENPARLQNISLQDLAFSQSIGIWGDRFQGLELFHNIHKSFKEVKSKQMCVS